MRLFTASAISAILLLLTACGQNPSNDDTTQAQLQRNREKLVGEYSGVVGTYKGTITMSDHANPVPGQVIVYIDSVYDGVDANGAPKTHPELRGELKLDGVGELDDHSFMVVYQPFDGAISFTQPQGAAGGSGGGGSSNSSSSDTGGSSASSSSSAGTGGATLQACAVGPRDPRLTINGQLLGGILKGTMNGSTGTLGNIEMTRTSTESVQPPRDSRDRLLKAYNQIVGTYDGVNNPGANPTGLRVVLKVEDQAVGEGITCPRLTAQLKYTQAIGILNDTKFDVSFRQSTGEIHFTGSDSGNTRICSVGPSDPKIKMDGTLSGTKLTGELTGTGGDLGPISLTRTSTSQVVDDDQRDRLYKSFGKIIGTYEGNIASDTGSTGTQLIFTIEEATVTADLTCPQLKAQFKYKNAIGRLNDTAFGVTYHEWTGEIHLIGQTSGNDRTCPVGPNDPNVKMDGMIGAGRFTADLKGTGGDLGQLSLKRVSNNTTITNDQRERLTNALAPIAGTYGGKFTGATDSFPIKLVINLVEQPVNSFISCPALTAQYIRADLSPGVGQLALTVDYHPAESTLIMKSTTTSQTGVPGHTDLSITAKWTGAGFQGAMQWWDRSGTVAATHCRTSNVSATGACNP